ncbi:MAG: hypothetical protein QOJ32_1532, partial [Frankiaceae bacterium]|nr:hypothetical protein [Frankiaceae bacterium]
LDGDGLPAPVRVEGYGPSMRALIDQRVRDVEGAPMTAVKERRPLVFSSPEDYLARFPGREDLVVASGMQSWVYMPLMASGRVIGTWSVSYAERHATPPSDLALLMTLAVLCAQTLERARLFEREREMARVLQRAIAPSELPLLPGIRFGARYVPATIGSVVGGDFFDVLPLPGDRAVIVLGDVVGHDIRAAAMMGQVQATLRAYGATATGPAEVLERANRLLGERPNQLATCCCLELDLISGTVTIARAGHPPPLLMHAIGSAELLEVPGGLPLGARADEQYPETTFALGIDDVLLLYTDGLVESRQQSLDEGLDLLVAVASTTDVRTPDALVERLLTVLAPEAHTDDIALLAMQRKVPAILPLTGTRAAFDADW